MDIRLVYQLIGAIVAGATSAYIFKADALNTPSGNIVSALSIINAAIFPTVVLSATVLKGAAMSEALVERYREALKTQISFFFGILIFSLMTIVAIIIAQAMNWNISLCASRLEYTIKLDWLFNFVIVFMGAFVIFRLPAFLRALVSLLDVHIDGVMEEVAERNKRKKHERSQELSELPNISGHQRPPENKPIGS